MKKMLAMAAGLALSLAVTAASGEDKLKVAFLYVGPHRRPRVDLHPRPGTPHDRRPAR